MNDNTRYWDDLSIEEKSAMIKAAVDNGITELPVIKQKYNEFAEGGNIYDGESEPTQQMNKNIIPWKALENIEYYAIPDTSFTRSKTGIGDIEYFSAEHPEGITYHNGYHRNHPMPGKDVLLYNPNNNDAQDIRLDALHIMPKDATYDVLNTLYREAAKDGDVAYNARRRYEEDLNKYGKENIDSYAQYFNNEADGLLRNMLIEGTPEYIESKRYYPNKAELREWNRHLLPYIDNIQNYLETGKRPANILPEVTVTANKKATGGNLYQTGGGIKGGKKRGDKVDTAQCATWSNGLLRQNGYIPYGNAWALGNVDMLFNGFDSLSKPEVFDRAAVEKYNHSAADSVYKNFDSKTLDKTKPYIVNMFYNNSPALEDAYKEGNGVTGTHTGVLTWEEPKNRWMVTHNIHGTIHQEPFVQLQNGNNQYGVTAVYAPREDNLINKVKGFLGFANGGPIHIKKENRGKFTRLKERTGHSASWFKAHGTPAQKKMATFALNARKWKHGLGGHIFDGTSEPTQFMEEDRFATTQMPQLLVSAKRKYIAGYDKNGNPIYTENPKESMGYTPTDPHAEVQKSMKAIEESTKPKYTDDIVRAAQGLIGAPLATIAGGPVVEAVSSGIGAAARALAPGSSFWMNPITKQMVTGTAMSEGVNLANKAVSGYNTVGQGIGDLVERGTGWNPNNTWLGPLVTEALNPGWYVSPNGVMNTVGRVGNVAEEFVKDAANTAKSYVLHPTYQTVYHGSPHPFNIKEFHRGTPLDLGLHVGPKDMAMSAGQEYGSKTNTLYKLRIPQADTETIDIGRNGIKHLSEDFVWSKHPHVEGWENMGYSFLSSNNKLLPKWLDEAGAELTIKPDDFRGYRMWTENDAHINLREKAFPNISKADRAVADKLLEDAKSYENVWDWEKAPQEMREGMSRINADAADLLSRNGYKVIKYFNNNEAEGAANAFIVTDPSVIDVMPDMSLSKYKDIWNSYQPIFGQSRLLQSAPLVRTQPQTPAITSENAASITPEVNWEADNWFKTISGRNSYSAEEAAELASHVPEYRAIEQRLFNEGKLIVDSNGNIAVKNSNMSPQEYIMRQSEAFQKMNPEHHYVGVGKDLRNNFENAPRDPNTKLTYEVWTDKKSPKNVEEYAYSGFGGHTADTYIETLQSELNYREADYNKQLNELKQKLQRGIISQDNYDERAMFLRQNFEMRQSDTEEMLEKALKLKETDPLNGGKVFDVTYPKDASETLIIDAKGHHWTDIPIADIRKDAPSVVSHYPVDYSRTSLTSDAIVAAAKRHGYDVTHINNVMDTGTGTLLNETIIGQNTPVKSVLGNTGSFDTTGDNKWLLYRGLLPFAGITGAAAASQRAYGGNLFSGEENHSSKMNQGHVYDVLPGLLRNAGLNIRVTSGYRKPGQAGKAGSKSWHTHHGAVDIVPQGNTTFEDIENVIYSDPVISKYMLDNGFGLLDESGRTAESKATMKKTGATGAHFHIGKDSKPAAAYRNRMPAIMANTPQTVQTQDVPLFMPIDPRIYNLDMYKSPMPIIDEPIVQETVENPYSKETLEREEKLQGLRNLNFLTGLMRGNDSSNQGLGLLGTINMLTN